MPENQQAEKQEPFYATEVNIARAYATHPITAEYIRRLEAIAEAAIELWRVTGVDKKKASIAADKVYDAASTVNFLLEED